MNSIEAMSLEIELQRDYLSQINFPKLAETRECLFVGNGDSLVSCMIPYYASGFIASCCTPLNIINNPKIATNRHVFFVSNSGNVESSIYAAKILRKNKIKTTAITSNRNSILAKGCNNIIEVKYPKTNVLTSGTIGFTVTTLTCLSIIGYNLGKNLSYLYEKSRIKSQKFVDLIFEDRSYIFLGEDILYPLAIYGALKINEIFGYRSIFYHLDEFAHAPIFGTRQDDYLFILTNNNNKKLSERLSESGLYIIALNNHSTNPIEDLITLLFVEQFIMIFQAQKKNLKECYFIQNQKYRTISSDIIYHK